MASSLIQLTTLSDPCSTLASQHVLRLGQPPTAAPGPTTTPSPASLVFTAIRRNSFVQTPIATPTMTLVARLSSLLVAAGKLPSAR